MILVLVLVIAGALVPVEKIVAVVGEHPILHSQVLELLLGKGMSPVGDFETLISDTLYLAALRELVENRLVVRAGIDAGYYPEGDRLDALLETELRENPAYASMDVDELSELLAERQAAQAFLGRKMQAALAETPLSPETYLASNWDVVEEMVMPRRIAWIYLPILPTGPDVEEACSVMTDLRERILAGESFEDIAMEYSDDNSAENGGYLGVFGEGELTATFEEAARALEPGEVSMPVITPFGVHLIRLEGLEDDGGIEVSHILKLVEMDSTDVLEALSMAREIVEKLDSGNLTFDEAAELYSRDRTTADAGGDLGIVPLYLWNPVLAEAVKNLEPGEYTEPIVLEDRGAVVIVKLLEEGVEMDWSGYTGAELRDLVEQVVYMNTYRALVDSLEKEIPVVYLVGEENVED